MEAWIYLTSTGNQTVFGTGADSLANRRNLLMFGGTKIQHTEVGGDVRQNGSIAINNWHYVCTTKDAAGGAGSVTLYANGNIEASTLLNPSYPPSTTTGATNSIFLGTNVSGTEALSGIIDEARFSTTERSSDWISTQYNNQNSASTFYSAGAQEEAPPIPWYNSSWTYRQKITIDSTKVSADLTDFPVYVDLADLGADFFSNVNTDGSDIRVTKSDGTTEVPREVVSIDTSGSTGELHFKADGTLSSSTDTDFYIYYGNASATEPAVTATYGRNNVWVDYDNVYHLNEEPTSATAIIDSTGNYGSTTIDGAMTASDLVAVKVGSGLDFDGSNDRIRAGTSNILNNITCQAWARYDGGSQGLFFAQDGQGSNNRKWYMQATPSTFYVNVFESSSPLVRKNYNVATSANTLQMYHFTYTVDTLKLYINGSLTTPTKTFDPTLTSLEDTTIDTSIGTNLASNWFDGVIDEARISSVVRSDDWISTEYNNQNSASTFYAAGAQETYTPSATFIPKITSVL